ncbi:MAG: hypothetical protein A2474_00990 [Elusimicrobia bacterium RIFOXYC2_FULL_34_12]|nr:MAG: hypothetical protein A2474_00990 [Elusimicrobia bacterium RIFOXYC2_FULL_34_12]OGS38141.1 MAG: hypothetical protein A2551_04235 [Elusimicrobia bacterium RIFOXYD2_FULL_34_30]
MILKTLNINKSFKIERNIFNPGNIYIDVVKNVSLDLKRGQILGIAGESGSGKTTFAKIISGLLSFDSGEVVIDNKNILDYTRHELARKIQMIFQDPFSSLNPKLSVGTIIYEAMDNNINKTERAIEMLKSVGLPEDSLHKYPHQFSGGQRQRIAIARALTSEPEIIIADEPVSSLDISIQAQIMNIFLDLKDKLKLSYIIILHDLNLLAAISDNIAIMKNGEIVEYGTSEEIINNPKDIYTQKLISSIPVIP